MGLQTVACSRELTAVAVKRSTASVKSSCGHAAACFDHGPPYGHRGLDTVHLGQTRKSWKHKWSEQHNHLGTGFAWAVATGVHARPQGQQNLLLSNWLDLCFLLVATFCNRSIW